MVQALAAQFARDRTDVRLNVEVVTGGPPEAAAAIDNGKADLAVVRRDTGMPKNGQVVAILRKNVVVFIVPSAPEPGERAGQGAAKGKAAAKGQAAGEDRKDRADGRQAPRRRRPLAAQHRTAEGDPAAIQHRRRQDRRSSAAEDIAKPNAPGKISVIQFDPNNVATAIRDSNVDVIMSVGPVGSPITADAIAAATRGKEPPTFLPIDAAGGDRRARAGLRIERDQGRRLRRLAAAAGGKRRDHRGAPLHRGAEDAERAGRRRLHQAPVRHRARRWPRSCRRPPRSRSPTPTRTPRCRCIRAPRPISTAS